MEKTFNKHETLFTIALIVIYVVMNSYMMQNFGYTSIQSAVANTILSVLIIGFIIAIKKVKYYGLVKANNPKKFLYFIPLVVISLYNLRNGINTDNPTNEIIYFVITMINVGFLEEIIFRGFLFKMMEKDNAKRAIIVSSITFGLGHLVNLLNGADFLSTLLQVIYAIAIGYMLVMVFYKSKSLLPCIIFHGVFNALNIFNNGNKAIIGGVILTIISLAYAIYINRKVKE